MQWEPIRKSPDACRVRPHLLDYGMTCAGFSWENVRRELAGLPGGQGLNIAHEAVDRHLGGPLQDRLAMRWLGKEGAVRDLTFADLSRESSRFANVLRKLGVGKGDRVFVLAGRIPELYFAALGTLKNTSVFCPMFTGSKRVLSPIK